MTNLQLFHIMWFGFVALGTGVGLWSGYLTWIWYGDRSRYHYGSDIGSEDQGLNAGVALTVIGAVLAFSSSFVLGRRLEVLERANNNTTELTTRVELGAHEVVNRDLEANQVVASISTV